MLAQSSDLPVVSPRAIPPGREPDNPYTIAERHDSANRVWWVVFDPATRLAVAEFKYLSAAVDCSVLVWSGDVSLPINGVLPLKTYGLPTSGREIGATFQPALDPTGTRNRESTP